MTAAVAGVGVEMAGGSVGGREESAEPAPGPSEGVTPLMYACQQGRDHTVRQIIHRKPSSVQERDRTGKTALHYCVENQTLSCIDQVVEAEKGLIGARDEDGYTPLHLATIAGNKAVVQYLLGRGADVKAVDNEKHTAVHWATVCGEVELLEMLIEAGADASTPDLHGAYPLHYAAQMCGPNSEMGNDVRVGLQVLRKLLQYGVDVSVTDHDGRTPLLWAASAEVRPSHVYCPSGSADAILALINAGASVSADDKDGLTALHCAASRGHLDCLDCLLNFCGAEVDTLDSNGCTPLFYAVTLGHADCTGLLLHHGAHPDKQDRKGRTPAHCGAAKGQLETLKLLHQKGADLWKRNVKGDLPLHEACQSGRRDLVLWLLSMRPDTVNAPNLDGRCPLHIAAINNNIEMCKILMDKQAAVNPIMRNSRGQLLTPLDAAVARSNRGCAKYLQLHGGMAASKLTDKHALQKAMQRALETSQQGSREQEGEELMSSSASSVHKSNRSTMTASPVNTEAQTETRGGADGVDGMKDAQEPGFSDGVAVGRESDVDGLTDPERHTEDEENAETGRRKSRTRRRKEKHRGRSGEEQLTSGQVESMETSLRRKGRKMASPSTEVSITQAMQNTMRKYALERRLFQQLLELKRAQIKNSRANEHVLIKRMVDVFQKEGMLLGLRGYSGPYNFNSYEKYLYDQLRFLQSSQGIKIPAFRPTDDVEKLSRAIRRAEIKELPDPLQNNLDAHTCNHTTHRCHHAAHAYTGIPCAAYIGYKKKKSLTANNNNNNNNNKQVSLPKIPGTQTGGTAGGGSPLGGSTAQGLEGGIGGRVRQGEPVGLRNYDPRNPLTVELQHGQARQQIVLPTDLLDKNKKYHLTFTIKPSTTKIKEQTSLETDPNEQVSSAPEILPSDPARQESLAMDSLASESQQESQSAALEAGTEA